MNNQLTEQIAHHIFSSFGVFQSPFINMAMTKSILDNSFLLPEKITFEAADSTTIKNNIWGAQISVAKSKDFRILIADCSQENIPEYCLVIQLKDAPSFGMYMINSKDHNAEALICVSTSGQNWMPCSTFLQGTLLSGCEQLKDLANGWAKCTNYTDLHSQLLSLIKFHDMYFDIEDVVPISEDTPIETGSNV